MTSVMSASLAFSDPASAELDSQLGVLDEQGRTLTIQQWDTEFQGVYPMDRNRLTREWFYSGQGAYIVSGPNADAFTGELMLGYQIGFPWSLGVGINFSYTSPNILLDATNFEPGPDFAPLAYVITPNFFPGLSISADLGNGPGVQEVVTFTAEVTGAQGNVVVSDAHGTVTGAAGGVLLRPFVRLVSSQGATVTTYGEPWNMK
ncbi:porin [Mycolicibacterium sp. P9-64]|uniref:MspA family porin n=1 Tax=Mycolicibacterium sp. P9-64 TaxID=2024612 RepID=UPI0011EC5971|nr:MspA family porin [Mycolicibacterium sp. P9-64]KAA0084789.1 porin [Mycolicibacterium sp. P9-64]